jgi:hypothetical protein
VEIGERALDRIADADAKGGELVRGATLETQHGNASTGGERGIAPRAGNGDVIDVAVVTADEHERFVGHDARPFEHTVDESGITRSRERHRVRGDDDDHADERDK